MKNLLYFSFFLIVADPSEGQLYHGYNRFPQRTIMFGGYYNNPSNTRRYVPPGTMSFASGDTIATNPFLEDQPSFDIQSSAEETTQGRHEVDNRAETSTSKPRRVPPSEEESDEEDVGSSWPFGGSKNGAPSYNAFFPIMLGGTPGLGRKASSGGEGYYPGAATAIANSFSTGKGGVATSHATSFGDPSLSSLFRNGNFNKKKSATQIKK